MSEFVTIVNRTQEPITGVWDSRSYVLTPGKHEYAREKAERFRAQHPVMGSENPQTGTTVYRLGIEEDHDDVSPLTPEFLAQFDGKIERWDRSKLTGARPSVEVAGDNGLYGMGGNWKSPQPLSSSFVDPNG